MAARHRPRGVPARSAPRLLRRLSRPIVFDHNTGLFSGPPLPPLPLPAHATHTAFAENEIAFSLTPEDYRRNIDQIKEQIAAGATYQVNFTGRIRLRNAPRPPISTSRSAASSR